MDMTKPNADEIKQAIDNLIEQGASPETIIRSNVNGYFTGEYACLNAMKAFDLARLMIERAEGNTEKGANV